jgi:hypothetical protein
MANFRVANGQRRPLQAIVTVSRPLRRVMSIRLKSVVRVYRYRNVVVAVSSAYTASPFAQSWSTPSPGTSVTPG